MLCSDETKIELLGLEHQLWVWRQKKDADVEDDVIPM